MNNPNLRVGIFVDVQNLYHSAKNLHRARVNYRELLKNLVGGRQLVRALAYVVKSEGVLPQSTGKNSKEAKDAAKSGGGKGGGGKGGAGNGKKDPKTKDDKSGEAAFFDALEDAGMELRMKDLQIYADGFKKADWDVGMAVDAIRMAPFLDVIILVTGDGDFIPLVEYLQSGAGRLVEVAAFRRSASSKLVEAADRFINIEDLPRTLMKSRNI